jgi:hypothetical protein
MKSLFQKFLLSVLSCVLIACGGGGSGSGKSTSSSNKVSSSSSVSPAPNAVLSGSVSFDYIPHNADYIGLDYQNIQARAARGVRVELLDANNNLVATKQTGDEGEFQFDVVQDQLFKIRVVARLQSFSSPSWNISVNDNTQLNQPYAIEGQLKAVSSSHEIRNIHAASGWNGSRYAEVRSAAPFAILDAIHSGIDKLKLAGLNRNLPALTIYWSEKNTTAEGDPARGEIGTSYFSRDSIYLLGDMNVDTDEYDRHVILHEWTHFLEAFLSRSDSLGGAHRTSDKLDMRLAFSEGFANAFAAMLLDDQFYKDALGNSQANGFFIDLADKSQRLRGWYSQGSVSSIFYNYYLSAFNRSEKSVQDIWQVLVREDFIKSPYFSTIFSFSEFLQKEAPDAFSTWSLLLNEQNINSTLASGEDEINDGGFDKNLPVYKSLSLENPAAILCSSNRFGSINHLANFQFAKISIAKPATYRLQVTNTNSNTVTDPDLHLYLRGELISSKKTPASNQEILETFLQEGEYILTVGDSAIINRNEIADLTHCFDVVLSEE